MDSRFIQEQGNAGGRRNRLLGLHGENEKLEL
jgi:hypothetical protein